MGDRRPHRTVLGHSPTFFLCTLHYIVSSDELCINPRYHPSDIPLSMVSTRLPPPRGLLGLSASNAFEDLHLYHRDQCAGLALIYLASQTPLYRPFVLDNANVNRRKRFCYLCPQDTKVQRFHRRPKALSQNSEAEGGVHRPSEIGWI